MKKHQYLTKRNTQFLTLVLLEHQTIPIEPLHDKKKNFIECLLRLKTKKAIVKILINFRCHDNHQKFRTKQKLSFKMLGYWNIFFPHEISYNQRLIQQINDVICSQCNLSSTDGCGWFVCLI